MGTDKTDSLKQKNLAILIRAGREIRGQNSFSNGVRKKWNRKSRQRTRKDEEFQPQKAQKAQKWRYQKILWFLCLLWLKISLSNGASKNLNRESRERTRKDEDFFNHNGSAADMDELTISNPSSNFTDGHG